MPHPVYALSLRQPWAALLASGRKTIEVRRWPTTHRGHFLIHASRIADSRPEVWRRVPAELREAARLVGGIVGAAELTGCVGYRTREAFAQDRDRHWNDPAWFDGSYLYGFTVAQATTLPFRSYPGWMRFFRVDGDAPKRTRPR